MRARSCFVVGRVWPARQGRLAGPAPSEALLESSPAVRRAQVYKLNPRQHDDIARHAVGTTPQQQRHLAACTCSQKPEVGACARAGNRCMLLFPHPRNAPLLLLKFDSSVASFCLLGEQGERARVRLAPPSSRGSSSEDRCVRSTCSIGAAGMLEGPPGRLAPARRNAKSVFEGTLRAFSRHFRGDPGERNSHPVGFQVGWKGRRKALASTPVPVPRVTQ